MFICVCSQVFIRILTIHICRATKIQEQARRWRSRACSSTLTMALGANAVPANRLILIVGHSLLAGIS